MPQRFVDAIKSFAARNRIEIVSFRRGERKDDRTRQYLRNWSGGEGVLYIGKAQEKAKVVRTERRHDPSTIARSIGPGTDGPSPRKPWITEK